LQHIVEAARTCRRLSRKPAGSLYTSSIRVPGRTYSLAVPPPFSGILLSPSLLAERLVEAIHSKVFNGIHPNDLRISNCSDLVVGADDVGVNKGTVIQYCKLR
jgi:hypothetical protein